MLAFQTLLEYVGVCGNGCGKTFVREKSFSPHTHTTLVVGQQRILEFGVLEQNNNTPTSTYLYYSYACSSNNSLTYNKYIQCTSPFSSLLYIYIQCTMLCRDIMEYVCYTQYVRIYTSTQNMIYVECSKLLLSRIMMDKIGFFPPESGSL